MSCSQCGATIGEGDAFCPMCGAAARATTPPPPPVQRPAPRPVPSHPATTAEHRPGEAAPQPTGTSGPAYGKAPLGGRLLALIADSIIASALLPLGILLIISASSRGDAPVAGIIVTVIAAIWQFAYSLCRDATNGAGFGKRLAGLVVVTEAQGTPAAAGPAIIRQAVLWALGLIPAIGSLIEPVMVLVDKDGRRLGDKAAKTRVARRADVAAAGVPVRSGKGLAVAVLVGALLISVVGSGIGAVALARSAYGGGGLTAGWDPEPEPVPDPPAMLPGEAPAPGTEPEPAPEPVPDPEPPATDADAAAAVVTDMLSAWRRGDGEGSRAFATREFQEEFDGHFTYPAGDALVSFQVTDVYKDVAIWAVVTEEEWISGPERITYWVLEEDGAVRVNYMAWDDDL